MTRMELKQIYLSRFKYIIIIILIIIMSNNDNNHNNSNDNNNNNDECPSPTNVNRYIFILT